MYYVASHCQHRSPACHHFMAAVGYKRRQPKQGECMVNCKYIETHISSKL